MLHIPGEQFRFSEEPTKSRNSKQQKKNIHRKFHLLRLCFFFSLLQFYERGELWNKVGIFIFYLYTINWPRLNLNIYKNIYWRRRKKGPTILMRHMITYSNEITSPTDNSCLILGLFFLLLFGCMFKSTSENVSFENTIV